MAVDSKRKASRNTLESRKKILSTFVEASSVVVQSRSPRIEKSRTRGLEKKKVAKEERREGMKTQYVVSLSVLTSYRTRR